ncbi:UDP-N-acetylmuramoyl-L-alanyl-D-glutamate--2,6-diaminopimelate ligase [Candidatus Palauibacter sp.]|uniref:UDP-N-acetylmuramoyl-L-alanyl-D-glutamate--2, 6-diaminopimelate ligase n=1 Tax=Candidatus Palauibacter sp. TaxID=3101350 RepID=UPI003AF1E3AB
MPQQIITSEQVERRLARAGQAPRWRGLPPAAFPGLRSDSRQVGVGDLFCAIPGIRVDGHTFVGAAARAGAMAAVVERIVEAEIPQLVVRDARVAASHLAALFAGDPGASLRLIGITGTNGKSTTAWLTRWILADAVPAAALGTLGPVSVDGEIGTPRLTTPDPIDLAQELAELRAGGAEAVALEVSSHALDQRRADGFSFDAVAFTSFSREHLEYHPDLEAYRAAKLRLLELLAPGGVCAVNDDEEAWRGIGPDGAKTLGYGFEPTADIGADRLVLSADSSRFRLRDRGETAEVSLPLPADFNVRNALAAAAIARGLGLPLERIAARLSSAPPVPGRMEVLSREPVLVIRDFAHNPDSCERALSTLRAIVPGRVIAVLGCGGDRDRGKRPLMGRILARLADVPIVTSDNPRSEDPQEICRDMVAGLPADACEIVIDRREAIVLAIARAGPADAVALLGKGHETTQIIGDERLPFDERRIVAEIVAGSAGANANGGPA